ncbi:Palmitoyltransferase [Spironucleus salmonicida]|uniref:Palmitoyltransferase n=1 Tax=Spironucleus salmonicida TaxID=348837 RepID=V6LNJ8_9EUKA|nr:Palmitoyltransferase [Spironucleus salmonicida]|eukprot:EST46247.1 DHHC zinc finger and transmembrane domain-containing protein [Spironucleus salmonicida]
MTKFIQILFCTEQCKKLSQNHRSRKYLKLFTLLAVSLLFCINLVGVIVQFFYLKQHIFSGILFGVYCYLMLLSAVNYFMTAFLDPGSISRDAPQLDRSCVLCQKIKPMRSHHCSQCQKCILKMDHHCPWVQQCVGYNNYGQFFTLMLFSSFTMIYSFIVMLIQLLLQIFYFKVQIGQSLVFIIISTISLVITGCFGFITSKLFFFHVHLIKRNLTTIEFYELQAAKKLDSETINYYDKGHKSNFREIIPYPVLMFIPGCRIKPLYNPYFSFDYRTNRELKSQVQVHEKRPVSQQTMNADTQLNKTDNNQRRKVLPPIRKLDETKTLSLDIETQVTNYTGQILPSSIQQ